MTQRVAGGDDVAQWVAAHGGDVSQRVRHGPRQALDRGVKLAGCTVHFVDEGTDSGPIIAQAVVPVLDDDTPESLAGRILEQEHRLYPWVLDLIARGQVLREGQRVRTPGVPAPCFAEINPPPGR